MAIKLTKEQLIKRIATKLHNSTSEELDQIYAFVYRHRLQEMVDTLVDRAYSSGDKGNRPIKSQFLEAIIKTPASFTDKIEFLNIGYDIGWIDESIIADRGIPFPVDISTIMRREIPDFAKKDPMMRKMLDITYAVTPAIGPGEPFLTLAHKTGSTIGHGDIQIAGLPFEIKGSVKTTKIEGGKLKGFGEKDWSSPNEGMLMREPMKYLALKFHSTPAEIVAKQPNNWNLNEKGLKFLSEQIVRRRLGKEVTVKFLTIIYSEIWKNYKQLRLNLNWIDSVVNQAGVVNFDKYFKEALRFQFNYYHNVERFKRMILINTGFKRIMTVDNADGAVKAFENGLVRVKINFAWTTGNFAHTIALKG